LKKGCKIMMLMNDPEKRWQNGSIGHVSYCDDTQIIVNIKGQDWEINKHRWDSNKYKVEQGKIKTTNNGYVEQYPLKVAYAISVHKSQGQTFDSIIINFGTRAFSPGMAYTAISRCKSLQGIYFSNPLKLSDIYFDKAVLDFSS